jgi:hypothetical protein
LALTSPTGGGRSVGIVRSRTKATEFSFSSYARHETINGREGINQLLFKLGTTWK